MGAWPDADAVRVFLAAALRRRALVAGLQGAGAMLVAAVLAALAAVAIGRMPLGRLDSPRAGIAILAIAAAAGLASAWWRRRQDRGRIATIVERDAPEYRNVLITASELMARPGLVRPAMGERVCRDARRVSATIDLKRLFPIHRALLALGAGLAASALVIVVAASAADETSGTGMEPGTAGAAAAGRATAPLIESITAVVSAPAYVGGEPVTLVNPDTIRVLEGGAAALDIDARATAVRVQTATLDRQVERDAAGRLRVVVPADASGVVTIEPVGEDGAVGTMRVVGLEVIADRAPLVRITEPSRDLFLDDASATLALGIEASDDLGLSTLAMTYTLVSGSGENFEFTEGQVAVDVARDSATSWSATGSLALGALGLQPGDMVVYRAVAADRRPGALPTESDAFIVEIVAPGDAVAGGFAVDDRDDRYAISQRMVIVKTERLLARAGELTAQTLADEAMALAAEQRQVRAEFVFMMGGELTDFAEDADPFMLHEEDEAHGEAEILAGRLVNQGRMELTRAVRAMSEAATLLSTPDLDAALTAENAALEALQRAFSKSRYILRTLAERESIDLERRLTGTITDPAGGVLPGGTAADTTRGDAVREVLSAVGRVVTEPVTSWQAPRLVAMARRVLGVDAESDALRQVAVALTDAARAVEAGEAAEAQRLVDDATAMLSAEARAGLPRDDGAAGSPSASRLAGAQADVVRQAGRGGGR